MNTRNAHECKQNEKCTTCSLVHSTTYTKLTLFFYKNQIISAQARCSYSKMAKISIFSQTLPLFMRLKCFSERAVSFTTSQWFVTSLVLELALPIDLNPRLTVLIKFVLIKEKKCMTLMSWNWF